MKNMNRMNGEQLFAALGELDTALVLDALPPSWSAPAAAPAPRRHVGGFDRFLSSGRVAAVLSTVVALGVLIAIVLAGQKQPPDPVGPFGSEPDSHSETLPESTPETGLETVPVTAPDTMLHTTPVSETESENSPVSVDTTSVAMNGYGHTVQPVGVLMTSTFEFPEGTGEMVTSSAQVEELYTVRLAETMEALPWDGTLQVTAKLPVSGTRNIVSFTVYSEGMVALGQHSAASFDAAFGQRPGRYYLVFTVTVNGRWIGQAQMHEQTTWEYAFPVEVGASVSETAAPRPEPTPTYPEPAENTVIATNGGGLTVYPRGSSALYRVEFPAGSGELQWVVSEVPEHYPMNYVFEMAALPWDGTLAVTVTTPDGTARPISRFTVYDPAMEALGEYTADSFDAAYGQTPGRYYLVFRITVQGAWVEPAGEYEFADWDYAFPVQVGASAFDPPAPTDSAVTVTNQAGDAVAPSGFSLSTTMEWPAGSGEIVSGSGEGADLSAVPLTATLPWDGVLQIALRDAQSRYHSLFAVYSDTREDLGDHTEATFEAAFGQRPGRYYLVLTVYTQGRYIESADLYESTVYEYAFMVEVSAR